MLYKGNADMICMDIRYSLYALYIFFLLAIKVLRLVEENAMRLMSRKENHSTGETGCGKATLRIIHADNCSDISINHFAAVALISNFLLLLTSGR